PLALPDRNAGTREETDKPGPVAAATFDGEDGHAELQRPAEQRAVPGLARLDLAAVELGAEPINSDRDIDVLVRVDPDCHRPLHHLASSPRCGRPAWTGLCRAKGRRLLSGHRPVERSDGGRQV